MYDLKYTECHDPRKMANLIKRHKLFAKEHRSSRFENNANHILEGDNVLPMGNVEFIKVSHFSTVVCRIDKKPVGLLVLENYVVDNTINTVFIERSKKRQYIMLGLVGTYVKPEFRNLGIGHSLLEMLDDHLSDKFISDESKVYMLAATGKSFDLVRDEMPSFCPVTAPYNSNKWKDTAKSWYTYHHHVNTIKDLEEFA